MSKKTIEEAWKKFYQDNQKTTIEAMNAEGWKTVEQVSKESGVSKCRLTYMANDGKLERTKRKIFTGNKTREINFIRPLV